MHHFAITIGPVVRTITQAKKTRELWAASFIFSFLMKSLLKELEKYGDIISPDIKNLKTDEKLHGAGIWPDRCFLQTGSDEKAETLKNGFSALIKNALNPIAEKLGGNEKLAFLESYFHVYAVHFNDEKDHRFAQTEKLATHLFRLNKMLDDLELTPKVISKGDDNLLDDLAATVQKIEPFYGEAFADGDTALRYYLNSKKELTRRVRSLPEIATREFSKRDFYHETVEKPIEDAIRRGEEFESQDEEQIFKKLKTELEKDLKTRHRYVAIVHADGDGVGSILGKLGNDSVQIGLFSDALMKFSELAVLKINAFGAMNVYAGGDDLMFISPLQNGFKDENEKPFVKTIYDLIDELKTAFSEIPLFKEHKASLSFGLSISYFKYPLGEAVGDSLHLLKQVAKKFFIEKEKDEKNALAVRVLTHSGQTFETTISQKGKSYQHWLLLFETAKDLDQAFIAGLMHKMDALGPWLLDACERGTGNVFFKHHCNEAERTPKWGFVEKVRDLAGHVFDDYLLKNKLTAIESSDKTPAEKAAEKLKIGHQFGQQLHAMLRLVQFQNAPDHD